MLNKKNISYILIPLMFYIFSSFFSENVFAFHCSCSGGGCTTNKSGCHIGTFDYDYKSCHYYCWNCGSCITAPCGNCCCSGVCTSCWGCTPAQGGGCDNGPTLQTSTWGDIWYNEYYCPGEGCVTPCVPNSVAGCQSTAVGAACCKAKETDALSGNGCTDGRNNDCDPAGLTDCDDPDCFSHPACNGEDIGLRMYDGTTTHKISAQSNPPLTTASRIRVKHSGVGRGIITVSSTHPMTLPLKVSVGGQKLSLRKYSPTCTPATIAADCGAPLWSGPTTCSGANVMQNSTAWTCVDNLCTSGATTNQIKTVCGTGCTAGACN